MARICNTLTKRNRLRVSEYIFVVEANGARARYVYPTSIPTWCFIPLSFIVSCTVLHRALRRIISLRHFKLTLQVWIQHSCPSGTNITCTVVTSYIHAVFLYTLFWLLSYLYPSDDSLTLTQFFRLSSHVSQLLASGSVNRLLYVAQLHKCTTRRLCISVRT